MDSCCSVRSRFGLRRIRFSSSTTRSTDFLCSESTLPPRCKSSREEMQALRSLFFLSGSNTPVAVNVLPAKEQRFSNEPPLGVLLASVPKQSGPVSPRPILLTSQKALHRHRRPEIAFRPWED